MTDPRNASGSSRLSLLFGFALTFCACTPQPSGQGSSGTPAGTTCAQEIMIVCPAGQVDGCTSGATKTHECVPAPSDAQCIDIRTALVKCKDGEAPSHAGCPEPDYMQRCAPVGAGSVAHGPESGGTAAPTPTGAGTAAPTPTGAGTAAPVSTAMATGPGPAAPGPAAGVCIDIRAALVRCKDGERPSHAGCSGPDYMQRCAPIGASK